MGILAVSAGIYLVAFAIWLWLWPIERRLIDNASRRLERALDVAGMTLESPPPAWEAHGTVHGVSIRLQGPTSNVPPGQTQYDAEDMSWDHSALLHFRAPGPPFACAPKRRLKHFVGDVTFPRWPDMGHEGFEEHYEFRAEQPMELSWWILDALVRLDLRWMRRQESTVTIAFGSLPLEEIPVVCDLAARWPHASLTPVLHGPLAPASDDLGVPRYTHICKPLEVAFLIAALGSWVLGILAPLIPALRPVLAQIGCGDGAHLTFVHPEPGDTSIYCSNGSSPSLWMYVAASFVSGAGVVSVGILGTLYAVVMARRPSRHRDPGAA